MLLSNTPLFPCFTTITGTPNFDCNALALSVSSVHQKLEGLQTLKPVLHAIFANPNPMAADQMRMAIREGKINLATLMEAQWAKMSQGRPLFKE